MKLRTLLEDAVLRLEEQRVESANLIRSVTMLSRSKPEPADDIDLRRQLRECQAAAMHVVERTTEEMNQSEARALSLFSDCAAMDKRIEFVTTECAQLQQQLEESLLYDDDDGGEYDDADVVHEVVAEVLSPDEFMWGLEAAASSRVVKNRHQISTPEPAHVPLPESSSTFYKTPGRTGAMPPRSSPTPEPIRRVLELPFSIEEPARINVPSTNHPHFPVGRTAADHGTSRSGGADVTSQSVKAPADEVSKAVTASDMEKSAGKLKVPTFPTIGTIDAWEASLARNLRAASAYIDGREIQWIKEIRTRTFEELSNSGEQRFAYLDQKLAVELIGTVPTNLKLRIEKKELEALEKDETLKGRQVAWMVLEHYQTNTNMSSMYGMQDLLRLDWKGDQPDQMESFLKSWDFLVRVVDTKFNESVYRDIFYESVSKSATLKEDIAHYKRLRAKGVAHPDFP